VENPEEAYELYQDHPLFKETEEKIKYEEKMLQPQLQRNKRVMARRKPEHLKYYHYQIEEAQKEINTTKEK